MIDLTLGLKLIDYLVKLFEKEGEARKKYLDRVIEPAYRAAEQVYQDYLSMLAEISDLISSGASREAIILHIEKLRIRLLPVRIRLRQLLQNYGFDGVGETKFEKGVWGLLRGGYATLEDNHTYRNQYVLYQGHTLLDVLHMIDTFRPRAKADRKVWADAVNLQRQTIDRAWAQATEGYIEVTSKEVPKRYRRRTGSSAA